MATLNDLPRNPTAMEHPAITTGPTTNLIAMANKAFRVPHASIPVCEAMKRPRETAKNRKFSSNKCKLTSFLKMIYFTVYSPKLNIAIPSPPSDSTVIDLSTILGSCSPHLHPIQFLFIDHGEAKYITDA